MEFNYEYNINKQVKMKFAVKIIHQIKKKMHMPLDIIEITASVKHFKLCLDFHFYKLSSTVNKCNMKWMITFLQLN